MAERRHSKWMYPVQRNHPELVIEEVTSEKQQKLTKGDVKLTWKIINPMENTGDPIGRSA